MAKYSIGEEVIIPTHHNLLVKGIVKSEPNDQGFYTVAIPFKPGKFFNKDIEIPVFVDMLRKPFEYPGLRLVNKSVFLDLLWTRDFLDHVYFYAVEPLELPETLDVPAFGTIGDLIVNLEDPEWRALRAIKERHPDLKLRGIICSASPGAEELFATNPYLDEIYKAEWDGSGDPNSFYPFKRVKEYLDLNTFELDPVRFYLDASENVKLRKHEKEDYIVLHPFARVEDRHLHCHIDLQQFIDVVREFSSLPIYVVGKSGRRTTTIGDLTMTHVEENGDYSGVTSLVNQTNLREAAWLVSKAKYFIGTHSAFSHAAYVSKVRSLILCPFAYLYYYLITGQIDQMGFNKLWSAPYVLPCSTTGLGKEGMQKHLSDLFIQ